MKRSARSRANRRNARFSTGPKTVTGKSRVARSALRHGLAIPAGQDPDLSAEIERLAVVLAGERAEPTRLEAARRIAEAQMNLLRVRRVRYALFADQAAGPNGSRERSSTSRHDNSPPGRAATEAINLGFSSLPETTAAERSPPLGDDVEAIAAGLTVLDRYERRALSRRKAAVRAFDGLKP